MPNASKAALEAHNSQLICLLYPVKKHAHVHTRARMPQRDGKRARLLLLLLLNFCYLHGMLPAHHSMPPFCSRSIVPFLLRHLATAHLGCFASRPRMLSKCDG